MTALMREDELAALSGLLDDAVAGRGRVALVSGAVGMGKSTLLDAFADAAAAAGCLPVRLGSAPEEGELVFGLAAQFALCAGLPERARAGFRAALEEAERKVAVRPTRTTAGPLDPAVVRVADALCALVLEVGGRTPVALVVDDAQHADAASLACLGYLLRRIRAARIVAVLGHADPPPSGDGGLLVDLFSLPHCREVKLGPLSAPAVAGMLAGPAGRPVPPSLVAAALAVTGGNPLLLAGLAQDLPARPADPGAGDDASSAAALEPGAGYARAVLICLRRGGTQMLMSAQEIAVDAGSGDARARLGVAGHDDRDLAQLTAAGLVAHGRLHPPARAAILEALPAPRRAGLYFARARAAYDVGRPAVVVAGHLRAAQAEPPSWAVSVLEEAARVTLAAGHVGLGVAYLELACAACADEAQSAKLRLALVRAEWRRNPGVSRLLLPGLVDAARTGHLSGGDALVLTRALLWHGGLKQAGEILDALAAAGTLTRPDVAAELEATRPWLRCAYGPVLEHVPEPVALGPAGASDIELRRRLDAAAALQHVLSGGPRASAADQAESVLRGIHLDGMTMDAVESALLTLAYADQPARAVAPCETLIREAAESEAPSRQARLLAIRAELALRLGALPEAVSYAQAAMDLLPARSWGVAVGGCLASMVDALTAMGRLAEARRVLALPVADGLFESTFGLRYLRARGRCELAAGDLHQAEADFVLCGELMERWNLDISGLIPWRVDLAEVRLRAGTPEAARPLLRDQLTRHGQQESPRAYGMALRVLARSCGTQRRATLLRRSAEVLRTVDDRYEFAQTLCELALVCHELGGPRRSGAIGRRAWSVAAECGAEPLTRRLGTALGPELGRSEPDERPGGGASAAAVLSPAEQRVVELAVLGFTNRDIAARLFITVSTVEQHLTSTYRKFSVSGRSELGLALAAHPTSLAEQPA